MKPTLCCDADLKNLKFPIYGMPKIDGVRSLNFDGSLTGRSLKQHKNKHVTEFFSHIMFKGFDGEMANEDECHPDLCRITSSALSTINGTPYILWHVFDYVTEVTKDLPFKTRYQSLQSRVNALKEHPNLEYLWSRIRVVPCKLLTTMHELIEFETECLHKGYEGIILRDPEGKFKQGRATAREGSYMRIKRFIDAECEVVDIVEGLTNNNEAQVNELGLQYRTSHKENMVLNGTVGSITGRLIADVFDPITDTLLFSKGDIIEVGPGAMKAEERLQYFQIKQDLIGRIFKFKTFPKGVKDKPRFPTFLSFRDPVDMV